MTLAVAGNRAKKHKKENSSKLALFLKQNTLCMRKGLLYWKAIHCNRDECTFQAVLLNKYENQAPKGCYDDIRHLEVENV